MSKERLTIKSWAEEDRPREKMAANGSSLLSDAELVAILIGSGIKGQTALDLAQKLLSTVDNNLNALGKLSIADFKKMKGIGEARAVTIAAALELGRRRKESTPKNQNQITCSEDIADIFYPILSDIPYEEFWILLLNKNNRIIDKLKISGGGVSASIVDVRIIAKAAVEKLASSVIAIHNHPSGSTSPSKEDKNITSKLQTALKYFDIIMLDHIIIGDNIYFSFADEGLI